MPTLSNKAINRITKSVKYTESRRVNLGNRGSYGKPNAMYGDDEYLYKISDESTDEKCQIGFEIEQYVKWGDYSIYKLKPLNGEEPIYEVPEGESEDDYKEYYNGDKKNKTNTGDPFIEFKSEGKYYIYLVAYITYDKNDGRTIEYKVESHLYEDTVITSHRFVRIASVIVKNIDNKLKITILENLYRVLWGYWSYPRYLYLDDTSTDKKSQITIMELQVRLGGNSEILEDETIEIKLENLQYLLVEMQLELGEFKLGKSTLANELKNNSGANIYDSICQFETEKIDDILYVKKINDIKQISYDSDWWS